MHATIAFQSPIISNHNNDDRFDFHSKVNWIIISIIGWNYTIMVLNTFKVIVNAIGVPCECFGDDSLVKGFWEESDFRASARCQLVQWRKSKGFPIKRSPTLASMLLSSFTFNAPHNALARVVHNRIQGSKTDPTITHRSHVMIDFSFSIIFFHMNFIIYITHAVCMSANDKF